MRSKWPKVLDFEFFFSNSVLDDITEMKQDSGKTRAKWNCPVTRDMWRWITE